VTLMLDVTLNALLIPRFGLTGAAAATTIALAAGATVAAIHVRSTLGAAPPVPTLVRITIGGAIVGSLSMLWPLTGIAMLVKCLALLGVFGLSLLALGEIRLREIPFARGSFSSRE
jgi:O-antigen/teichoic acid export membrane protein